MRSVDLINYQEGRNEITDSQVGKGEEINSTMSSSHHGVLMEEDQRWVLIIRVIKIFLPSN
jgi:hypothetical protein